MGKVRFFNKWGDRSTVLVVLLVFWSGWMLSCSKRVLHEPLSMKVLPVCENTNSVVRLHPAAFKIPSWSECKGSICKYSHRLGNVFLLPEPCQDGCLIYDGPFFTVRNLNLVLIPAEFEGARWVSEEQGEFLTYEVEQASAPYFYPQGYLSRIYGKIIDTVSGRAYTQRGYSQIMYLDFEDAPVVEYTKLEYDDKGIDCSK